MRGLPGLFVAAMIGLAASPAWAGDGECGPGSLGPQALTADAPVTILTVSTERLPNGGDRYCLVTLRVGENVNIAVGLPMDGRWNGDLQAEGKGGYGGRMLPPTRAVSRGYIGVATDGGHVAEARDPDDTPSDDWRNTTGAFAMLAPGKPNIRLQKDFAYRASHLMALVAKQVAARFYGHAAAHAYWNGCSTEGRQGLRAAQQYPEDYDGILAGDPAISFAEVMAYQIWPQLVMRERVGGPIRPAKLDLASHRAIEACDRLDGLADGLLTDPRLCRYEAAKDETIVRPACRTDDGACLSPAEASAIDQIWQGPTRTDGTSLWRGIERGASLELLAGAKPFAYALVQPRYWVYLDPRWDWRSLTIAAYPTFFDRSVAAVDPIMGSDDPDLGRFFARGGKIILYHGFDDPGILPHGSIDYYEAVARRLKLSDAQLQSHFQLYLFPGVGHCGGGDAPQPPVDRMLDALAQWVGKNTPPHELTAVQDDNRSHRRVRPVCAYPDLPYYEGHGDPDAASSFKCRKVVDGAEPNFR